MKVQRTVGEPVVMYHGTSSGMLDHILAHGLLPPGGHVLRSSSLWDGDVAPDKHLHSLDGTYLAVDKGIAWDYAERTARLTKGEQVLVTASVMPSDTLPDEDSLLEFIGNYGTDIGRLFDVDASEFMRQWKGDDAFKVRVTLKVAADLTYIFRPSLPMDVLGSTSAMLDWLMVRMDTDTLSHAMVERGCHLAPHILAPAMGGKGGVEDYRRLMDGMCKSLREPQPYDGWENHTVRLVGGLTFQGSSRIVAVGTLSDPFLYFGTAPLPSVRSVRQP